jgi:hypothetical protein
MTNQLFFKIKQIGFSEFDQLIVNEEQNDVKQLNLEVEGFQFSSKYTCRQQKHWRCRLSPSSHKERWWRSCCDLWALQDTGVWPVRISNTFRNFMVKRGTAERWKSFSWGRMWAIVEQTLVRKENSKMVRRSSVLGRACSTEFLFKVTVNHRPAATPVQEIFRHSWSIWLFAILFSRHSKWID